MGLRVNTNISSLNALRNLGVTDRAQARSLERLSSGLRINRGSDDPSGLVISERLRQQISALKQNSENSQGAANLISTADASMQKISDLLTQVQDSIEFALSTGSSSPDQIAAEQDSVDQAIDAIDRIANTTRYGDRGLLNGTSGYKLNSSISHLSGTNGVSGVAITDINFRSVSFVGSDTERTIDLHVERAAQRAEIHITNLTLGSTGSTFRVTGGRGSAEITIASNASAGTFVDAVNSFAETTGVYAQNYGGDFSLYSEGFGDDQVISLQGVAGDFVAGLQFMSLSGTSTTALLSDTGVSSVQANTVITDRGENAQVSLEGVVYTGKGLAFNINAPNASFDFKLNSDLFHTAGSGVVAGTLASVSEVASTGISIEITRTGLEFQMREKAQATDRLALGIRSMNAALLGQSTHRDVILEAANGALSAFSVASGSVVSGGFLTSLKSGQANDLSTNAGNALNIVTEAASQVAKTRGFLGAIVGFNVEPNIDSIDVAVENLSASLSSLRDLNFAEETANFARTQILFQSGIAALASARVIPQSVLQLLG